jgi:signal transduction histidine kinase
LKKLLITLFIFGDICALAQQKKLDSLLTVNINYKKEDSVKVIYLTNIFRQYTNLNDFNNVEVYASQAIILAKKLPQTFSLIKVYEKLGLCYHGKAKYLQALEAYNNGIAVAKNRNYKKAMAGFYLNISALYGSIPDYNKSLEALQMAIALFTEVGATDDLSSCYMNMGDLYNSVNNPVMAITYINKALGIFKTAENGLHYGTAIAYKGMAYSYKIASDIDLVKLKIKQTEKYSICLTYLDSALKIAKVAENAFSLIGPINSDIAAVYEKIGSNTLALNYYQAALKTDFTNDKEGLGNLLYAVGNFYYNTNNFTQSKNNLQKSLAIGKESGLLLLQQNTLEKISAIYQKTKKYDSAFIFYKQSIAIKDTIFNADKEKEITRKQLTLDFSIKENDYKLVQQISDGKLKQQELQIGFDKKVKIFLAFATALVLLIGGLIFNDRRKTKKLNTVINNQKTELEKLGQVKDKIFSVVSHDMRAPVNSLMSFINILEEGNIPQEKLALYSKDLKQSLTHTSALMNNLLNWAASQMQGFKPAFEKFDASILVTEVTNTLKHHLMQKNVRIQNNIAPNTFIYADTNMTAAICRNLMSNAIKYSYKDGIITISLLSSKTDCTLLISDEGTGMQQAQLDELNNNNDLQQAESKKGTANEKGTGLGLMLCKTFAAQMGGEITAFNNEKGTTFKVSVPQTNTLS